MKILNRTARPIDLHRLNRPFDKPELEVGGSHAIRYRRSYANELTRAHVVRLAGLAAPVERGDFVKIDADGQLSIAAGYSWDGPPFWLSAFLVADALRQAGWDERQVGRQFRHVARHDGASRLGAWLFWAAAQFWYVERWDSRKIQTWEAGGNDMRILIAIRSFVYSLGAALGRTVLRR